MSDDSVNWGDADQLVYASGFGASVAEEDIHDEGAAPEPKNNGDDQLPPSVSAIEPWKAEMRLPLLTIEEVEDAEDRQKHPPWFFVRLGIGATTGLILLICLAVGAIFVVSYFQKSVPSPTTARCGATCKPQRLHIYYYRESTPVQVGYMLMPL